jgi:hypothetical protein
MMQPYFWRVLVENLKRETRRFNKQGWVNSHIQACVNSNLVRVWCGRRGLVAGHVLYNKIYEQRLCDMTESNLELEGFGEGGVSIDENHVLRGCNMPLGVTDFCEKIVDEEEIDRLATVLNFTFFPYT